MPFIYSWEPVYKAAIDETDPAKRPERLLRAEETILNRIIELERVPTRQSINELAWLEKAVGGLAKVQSELLSKPSADPEGSEAATTEPMSKAKATGSA